jgi:hypothetical protein
VTLSLLAAMLADTSDTTSLPGQGRVSTWPPPARRPTGRHQQRRLLRRGGQAGR